jgi:aspartokinase
MNAVDKNKGMEISHVNAIAHSMTHAYVTYSLTHATDVPSAATCTITQLMKDLYAYCLQNVIQVEGLQIITGRHLSFLIAKTDSDNVLSYLESLEDKYGLNRPDVNPNIVTVTLAGLAIGRDAALMHTLFNILNENDIPLLIFQATETKINLTVSYDHMPKILTVLHDNLIS